MAEQPMIANKCWSMRSPTRQAADSFGLEESLTKAWSKHMSLGMAQWLRRVCPMLIISNTFAKQLHDCELAQHAVRQCHCLGR